MVHRVTEVVEAGLLTCLGFELLRVECHRQNLLLTAVRRAAIVALRSAGVTGGCSTAAAVDVRQLHDVGGRHRRRLCAHTAEDHGPGTVPGGVQPVGHPGVVVSHHDANHPVVVDRASMPVQLTLVTGIVDGLPPRVPEREAPVQALGGRDLEIKASSASSCHEPITGRFSAAAPIVVPSSGGRKVFGVSGRGELQEELQVGDDEVTQGDQLTGRDRSRVFGSAPCRLAGSTNALDGQRRGDLGVPVVEEVPHDQRGRVLGDRKPVALVELLRQNEVDFASGPKSSSSRSTLADEAMPAIDWSPT